MKRNPFVPALFLGLSLVALSAFMTRTAQAETDTAAFRCQARVTSAEAGAGGLRDRTRQALLSNGVQQAVAALLTPEEAQRLEAALVKSVYARPDRYVSTYQILSEKAQGDALEMVGEVTVSMNLLRSDLKGLGAQTARSAPVPASAPAAAAITPLTGPAPNAVQPAPAAPAAGSSPTSRPSAVASPLKEPLPGRELLWVVAERWSGNWVLPAEDAPQPPPFFQGVSQEIGDYGWTLVAPRGGSVAQLPDGSAQLEDALALAAAMSVPVVVTGQMTEAHAADGQISVSTELKLIDVATNQHLATIRQQWRTVGVTNTEASMQLANLVAPGIDQVVSRRSQSGGRAATTSTTVPSTSRPPTTAALAPPSEPAPGPAVPLPAGGTAPDAVQPLAAAAGEQVVEIRGRQAYAAWEALQALLTSHSGALQVTTLELIPRGLRAHVVGVNAELLSTFNGHHLNDQLALRLDQARREDRTIVFSTIPAAAAQPSPLVEQPQP